MHDKLKKKGDLAIELRAKVSHADEIKPSWFLCCFFVSEFFFLLALQIERLLINQSFFFTFSGLLDFLATFSVLNLS